MDMDSKNYFLSSLSQDILYSFVSWMMSSGQKYDFCFVLYVFIDLSLIWYLLQLLKLCSSNDLLIKNYTER